MDLIATAVRFQTDSPLLQRLFDTAERKLKENIRDFGFIFLRRR
jgi:hypothetical protein